MTQGVTISVGLVLTMVLKVSIADALMALGTKMYQIKCILDKHLVLFFY